MWFWFCINIAGRFSCTGYFFTGLEILINWPIVKGFWRFWSQSILESWHFWLKQVLPITKIIASDAQRNGTSFQSRACFHGHIRVFKHGNISDTIDLFDMTYGAKNIYFWLYNVYPWSDRPCRVSDKKQKTSRNNPSKSVMVGSGRAGPSRAGSSQILIIW